MLFRRLGLRNICCLGQFSPKLQARNMSDWKWGDQFGIDDDEEADEQSDYQRAQWGTKDGLILLIDGSEDMFKPGDDEENPFELCVKCAKTVIQNKIISSDKDLMGIVLFGTEKDKNPSDFKHVYILHDLDLPGAEKVLELEDFINEPNNNDFKKKYGHNKGYSLSEALWTCSTMFSNCSQKLGFKRVMLFTNNDNPHSGNAQLRRQAATKAEDLSQNGIHIELLHMNKPGHLFDVSLFYKDILFGDEDDTTDLPDPSERFEELLHRVRSKDHKKRAYGRLKFNLGKDLNFSVGVYNLVRTCYAAPKVKLYKKNNEEVKRMTKTFLEDTGEILMPQDMKKAQAYGGRNIYLENEEVTQIKKFDNPGIKLMGFKPKSSVKKYYHVKPAQFIYPDETTIEGSTAVFTALLKKCLDRDVVPICRYIPRRNTPPRFAALLPQAEELDDQNVQISPPGFHVIILPFADDFRKVKAEEDLPKANTEQIDKAKDIVKKLQFKFSSDNFENPTLQTRYAFVEALALDRDSPDEVKDLTMPNEKMIEKRAGKLVEEFKNLVFPEDYVPGQAAKRGGGRGGGPAAKKPKVEVDVDVEQEAQSGRLGKLTVPILKEFIKKKKIPTSGTKKADLVDAINEHFGI